MPDRLREFVYLDDISVNSHLSSLGEGRPEEIVDVSEESTETSGAGDIGVASGSRTSESVDSTETQMSATAPYRFERLLRKLDEEDIPIVDNPEPRSVSRGSVVRISGTFHPMSLYKTEIAVRALLSLIDEETAQSVATSDLTDDDEDSGLAEETDIPGRRDTGDDPTDEEVLRVMYEAGELFRDLAEEFIGDSVPLRIDYPVDDEESASTATLLDREKFDLPHMEAFFEPKEYVLFGRVDERVSRNNEWDPVKASDIMGRYFENEESSEWRDDWRETAENMGISLDDEDLTLQGRSLVIHPIAVYW